MRRGNLGVARTAVLGTIILAVFIGGCASSTPLTYRVTSDYGVDDPQFLRTIGHLLGPPLTEGNRVTTLQNGDEIFPAMLDGIRQAKRSINFVTYIYWSGDIAHKFADALSERARAGVIVNVLIDWVGGDRFNPQLIAQMKQAGVHFAWFHPFSIFDPESYGLLDNRTHRKLLIIDGRFAFTGGVGIAEVWRGAGDRPGHWRDNHYLVEGPTVAWLQSSFIDEWIEATGNVLEGQDYFPPLQPRGDLLAQVFQSSYHGGSENMELLVLLSIAAARHHLRLETAYFVPDPLTRHALIEARRRGVDVEILTPGPHIDEKIVRQASRARWGELMQAGIKIYEFQPTMLHVKLMIVDDLWVSVGSANFDNRSFRVNDETNLNVYDGAFAAQQIGMFERDKAQSKQIDYQGWLHRPWQKKLADALSTLLNGEL